MAPVIGISTYREVAAWGIWHQTADLLHTEYANAITAAGGAAVLLPPATSDPSVAAAVVARLDGLVIAGGADVDPELYGEQPHSLASGWRRDRDAWELALLTAAADISLPTLGICRGMQLMAVEAGGALTQHTPDLVRHERHGPPGPDFGTTVIRTHPGSRVATIIGSQMVGSCHHHQSVKEHPGFNASAWADDGTVEAMETTGPRFCVAVQWHPEMMSHSPDATTSNDLFFALIGAAGDYRSVLDNRIS